MSAGCTDEKTAQKPDEPLPIGTWQRTHARTHACLPVSRISRIMVLPRLPTTGHAVRPQAGAVASAPKCETAQAGRISNIPAVLMRQWHIAWMWAVPQGVSLCLHPTAPRHDRAESVRSWLPKIYPSTCDADTGGVGEEVELLDPDDGAAHSADDLVGYDEFNGLWKNSRGDLDKFGRHWANFTKQSVPLVSDGRPHPSAT